MSEYVAIEDALEVVRANGYVAIKEKSYRQAQERQRVADALRCAAEENAKSTQAWVERDLGPEARRLADRLTYVYGVAMAHGATRDELAGSTGFEEDA